MLPSFGLISSNGILSVIHWSNVPNGGAGLGLALGLALPDGESDGLTLREIDGL